MVNAPLNEVALVGVPGPPVVEPPVVVPPVVVPPVVVPEVVVPVLFFFLGSSFFLQPVAAIATHRAMVSILFMSVSLGLKVHNLL